jgi:hypothetical protein
MGGPVGLFCGVLYSLGGCIKNILVFTEYKT